MRAEEEEAKSGTVHGGSSKVCCHVEVEAAEAMNAEPKVVTIGSHNDQVEKRNADTGRAPEAERRKDDDHDHDCEDPEGPI